jgi:hypothetical protein
MQKQIWKDAYSALRAARTGRASLDGGNYAPRKAAILYAAAVIAARYDIPNRKSIAIAATCAEADANVYNESLVKSTHLAFELARWRRLGRNYKFRPEPKPWGAIPAPETPEGVPEELPEPETL